MKKGVRKDAGNSSLSLYSGKHKRISRRQRIVTCLAAVVVFCTVYALILPAMTLEKQDCTLPEHTHTEDCYALVAAADNETEDVTVPETENEAETETETERERQTDRRSLFFPPGYMGNGKFYQLSISGRRTLSPPSPACKQ